MKKAFIALMSTFIGLFGYTIVDEALEARVANLESSVSSQAVVIDSQQDEIESLHFLGKYSTTTKKATTTRVNPTTATNFDEDQSDNTTVSPDPTAFSGTTIVPTSAEYWKNRIFQPVSGIQTKHMYRVYNNGRVDYVPTGVVYPTTAVTTSNDGQNVSNTSEDADTYKECFLYYDSSELKVTSAEVNTKQYSYYDQDYSMGTTDIETNFYVLQFSLTGHTDKELAGKTAYVYYLASGSSYEITHWFSNLNCEIDEDGNFTITGSAVLTDDFILNLLEGSGYQFRISVF